MTKGETKVEIKQSETLGPVVIRDDVPYSYHAVIDGYIREGDYTDVMWSLAKERGWEFRVTNEEFAERYGEMLFLGRKDFMEKYREKGRTK